MTIRTVLDEMVQSNFPALLHRTWWRIVCHTLRFMMHTLTFSVCRIINIFSSDDSLVSTKRILVIICKELSLQFRELFALLRGLHYEPKKQPDVFSFFNTLCAKIFQYPRTKQGRLDVKNNRCNNVFSVRVSRIHTCASSAVWVQSAWKTLATLGFLPPNSPEPNFSAYVRRSHHWNVEMVVKP